MDLPQTRPSGVLNAILVSPSLIGMGAAPVAKTELTNPQNDVRIINADRAPANAVQGAVSWNDAAYRATIARQTGNQIMMAGFQAEQDKIATDKPFVPAGPPALTQAVTESALRANMDLHGRRSKVLGEFTATTNPVDIYEAVKKIDAKAPPATLPIQAIAGNDNNDKLLTGKTEPNAYAETYTKSALPRGALSLDQILAAPQRVGYETLGKDFQSKAAAPVAEAQNDRTRISPIASLFKTVRMAASDLLNSIKDGLADANFMDVANPRMIEKTGAVQIGAGGTTLTLQPRPAQLTYTPAQAPKFSPRPANEPSYARFMPRGGVSYAPA